MAHSDPLPTQRDTSTAGIPAELVAAGFEEPDEIGRGGFGVVYRCNQRALDRTVAVKVLTADLEPDNLERFVREQLAMGKLSGHPHIVSIFQVGTTATGRPYIVMQYHPHGSLEAKIHDTGPIDWRDSVHVGVKVAGATLFFVDDGLDTGPIVGQTVVEVKPDDDVDTLTERIKVAERAQLVRLVAELAERGWTIAGRRVSIP